MRAKFQRKDKSMSDVKWIKFDKTFFDDLRNIMEIGETNNGNL